MASSFPYTPTTLWREVLVQEFLETPHERYHLAACRGDTTILRELHTSDVDKERGSRFGTPLHVAIYSDQIDAIRVLLGAGANVEALHPRNAQSFDEPICNSLRLAVGLGRRKIFQMLWDAGAATRHGCVFQGQFLENFGQESLLELAASVDNADIVADLLDISNEWTQEEMDNALCYAARLWSPAAVKALLASASFSADTYIRSLEECQDGSPRSAKNSLYWVNWTFEESRTQVEVLKLLLAAYPHADLAELVCEAARRPCCIEALRFLLFHGADANATCEEAGPTPLHVAVEYNSATQGANTRAALLLLQCGAKSNITNDDGQTALHLAAKQKCAPELIGKLLEAGANAGAPDNAGTTPMIEFAYSQCYKDEDSRESHLQLLVLLLSTASGKFDWVDKQGRSVRRWAGENGLSEDWTMWIADVPSTLAGLLRMDQTVQAQSSPLITYTYSKS